ncbi:MAG: ribosome biogenesis GTPase Der [Gammaproteobacteria bacterium]|nr:ribosome biogenesis GTPase Der [Gammaproteobacteria bacterium]NIR81866.1 ribosome biogenesis GTPase Der [Gammaproteobacteria bacterium]NIR88698.1 ribosome biogenesis GTPase Der [Gammaproteobacteria bacterium]NIU02974.1 ribosome biogenesis GTPase Der [Gammaproteobacteria bacterium]NIV50495.1 ribosome biogenesis GTPase Der [Gammaproteobacteria bacterium]
MLPVIAIVGRPNVGKSTLFNCLTRSRNALVADEPGLTRDRRLGISHTGERPLMVVDTGGLGEEVDEMGHLAAEQAWRALAEADVALLVADARTGLTPGDELVAERLRSSGLPVVLALNKAEGLDPALAEAEFHTLGLGRPQVIAARHGYGIQALVQALLAHCPPSSPAEEAPEAGIRVAIVGRPNVGKSTLINRILGHERVLTHARPGTTRDSVYIPLERDGRRYTLIDTAGIRRRARVADRLEKFSVVQSLQAIEAAEVAIVLMDAREGVTDQDAHLVGMVLDAGRAIVLALNKWDGLDPDQRRFARRSLERKLAFAGFARMHFISALHGTGVGELLVAVERAWESGSRDLSTPELTRILESAVSRHAPPSVRGRRIKLRYAHQGGRNPPLIVVHGTRTGLVPNAYRRYLERVFQQALGLEGTPVRIEFRTGANPYRSTKAGPPRDSGRTR